MGNGSDGVLVSPGASTSQDRGSARSIVLSIRVCTIEGAEGWTSAQPDNGVAHETPRLPHGLREPNVRARGQCLETWLAHTQISIARSLPRVAWEFVTNPDFPGIRTMSTTWELFASCEYVHLSSRTATNGHAMLLK